MLALKPLCAALLATTLVAAPTAEPPMTLTCRAFDPVRNESVDVTLTYRRHHDSARIEGSLHVGGTFDGRPVDRTLPGSDVALGWARDLDGTERLLLRMGSLEDPDHIAWLHRENGDSDAVSMSLRETPTSGRVRRELIGHAPKLSDTRIPIPIRPTADCTSTPQDPAQLTN